jgi:hypothetical protein
MQMTQVQSPVVILYAIQGMFFVLVLLFAAMAARAVRRAMPWRFWFWPMEAAVGAGLFAAVWILTGVRASQVFLAISAGVGAAFGLFPGLAGRPFASGGRLVLKRTGLSWFLLATSYGLAALAAWFLPKPFVSASLAIVAWATGGLLGDDIGRFLKGAYWSRVVRKVPMAPRYVPEEARPPIPSTPAMPGSAPLDMRPAWAQTMARDMSSDAPWRQRRPFLVLWLTGFDQPFREQDKVGAKRKGRKAGRLKAKKKPDKASGPPPEEKQGDGA